MSKPTLRVLTLLVCFAFLLNGRSASSATGLRSAPRDGTGNKAETKLLPAPPSLNKHGAYFYDLRLTSKANASLNLYSGMGVLRATVDSVGDVKSRRLLYRISSPGGASEWVRVDLQETVYGMLYKAGTSSG